MIVIAFDFFSGSTVMPIVKWGQSVLFDVYACPSSRNSEQDGYQNNSCP